MTFDCKVTGVPVKNRPRTFRMHVSSMTAWASSLDLVIKVGLKGNMHLPCAWPDPKNVDIVFTYEGWNFNSGNYLFTTDTK